MRNPAAPTVPGAWHFFLSSTVRDMEAYRLSVQEVCLRRAQATCLLSEKDWPAGYQNTVDKCVRQIKAADAFLLVIGYWYGSIPPGSERSITHIEFDTAWDKWKIDPRPMAVMVPEKGSAAAMELSEAAEAILKSEEEAGLLIRARHDEQLEAFRNSVTGSWYTVDSFGNMQELLQIAIACCWRFQGKDFRAAATGAVTVTAAPGPSQVTEARLGALGRDAQITAAKAILAELADRPDVPAVAMIASGDEDAGQRAFLQRLIGTELKKYSPRREPSTLPVQVAAEGLAGWVNQLLGLTGGTPDTPALLAERVAAELKHQPLLFSLDRLDDLTDGPSGFREKFWKPFYDKLLDLRRRDRFVHRLVALVSDYSAGAEQDEVTSDPQAPDYTRLVRLPMLGPITRKQILKWFDELDVPDDAAGRRATLADRVMKASKGVPLRAFDRLRGEALWPEGETA